MADLTPTERGALAYALPDYRAALAPLARVEWRAGRTLGTTVYAVTTPDWKRQVNIGRIDTPELAARAIAAHNTKLVFDWLLAAGLQVSVSPYDQNGIPAYSVRLDVEDAPDPFENESLYDALCEAQAWADEAGYAP